jgi:hypothetical protein
MYVARHLYLYPYTTVTTHYSNHVGNRPLAGDAATAGDTNSHFCHEEESKMGIHLHIFVSIFLGSSSTCLQATWK